MHTQKLRDLCRCPKFASQIFPDSIIPVPARHRIAENIRLSKKNTLNDQKGKMDEVCGLLNTMDRLRLTSCRVEEARQDFIFFE